jgi:hypothetical protein
VKYGYLAALALVIALGVLSRRHPIGLSWYDKSLGDALYAAAAYLTLALLRPCWPAVRVAGIALGFCVVVELFQLTGLPARFASVPPVRWLLGTQFAWEDIGCYLVGIAVTAGIDTFCRRRAGTRKLYGV